jgi:5-methylcytosine-specific restriction endonuclease McrA
MTVPCGTIGTVKTCRKCGEEKPLEAFVKDKRCKDGCRPRCKSCANTEQRRRYVANDYREQVRKYEVRNRGRLRVEARERMKEWRHANPEKAAAAQARSRERLLATQPNYFRDYYHRNLERERRNGLDRQHRRRALIGGPASPELAEFMAQLVQEPCAYCGATENITVDHIVPISRGGTHEAENMAPACQRCNCSKGSKLLSEWTKKSLS